MEGMPRLTPNHLHDRRRDAEGILSHALEECRPDRAVQHAIQVVDGAMMVDGHRYEFASYERLLLIGIGKAAKTLTDSFLQSVGDAASRFEGVVTHTAFAPWPAGIQCFNVGHPSPTQGSLDAAAATLKLLHSATERDLVVFLISGGGSSMMEQMLDPGIALAEIAATHRALVECGAPIAAMNAVRKHLSAVKGGRLAVAAAPAEQISLFLSDVPSGELDALASGPTMPDRSTLADARRVVTEYGLAERLPQKVLELLASPDLPETPKLGNAVFQRSHWRVLLDSDSLAESAAAVARRTGWQVTIDNTCDDWPVEAAAKYLIERLEALKASTPDRPVCLISSGEVTVRVPPTSSGRGGRNQHFALLCAVGIAGKDYVVLSAGTDGIDGNSPAAGALVDSSTIARSLGAGFSIQSILADFDSYRLLASVGDILMLGATGNNLRDLRILMAP